VRANLEVRRQTISLTATSPWPSPRSPVPTISARTVGETLQQIVDFAVLTVEGCDAAGISLLAGSRVTTPVYSHPLALEIDSVQYDGEAWDIIRRPFWMSLSRGTASKRHREEKTGEPV
jgi:hypothetical protein